MMREMAVDAVEFPGGDVAQGVRYPGVGEAPVWSSEDFGTGVTEVGLNVILEG